MRGDSPGGPIRWRLHVSASPEKVFATLNTRRRPGGVLGGVSTGDRRCHLLPVRQRHELPKPILERKEGSVFAVDYFAADARFELSPDGKGGTDVTLTHMDVATEVWNEVHAGWLNVLFPLKAWVAYGVDLRNHDPKRLWDDGFVDQ